MSNNRELNIIIKAENSNAVEEINKVDKEVAELGQTANKTGKELEKLDKELDKTGKEAAEASTGVDKVDKEITELGQTVNKTEKEIEKFDKGLDKAGKGASKASQDIEKLDKNILRSSDDSNRFAKTLGGMGAFLKNAGLEIRSVQAELGEYTFAINQSLELLSRFKRYAGEGWEFAKQGAQLRAARDSFDDYARSVNKSSSEILSKLRMSSGGTIDDMNLVKTASLAMSLGVTQDASKMANLLEIARNKARLFGIGTQQAFEDIVTGIGRASPKILDNLGIRIPAAFEKMTEGMSDTEKVAKLFDLTLEEGNKQLRDMGGLSSNNADQMAALGASWENMKGSSGELVSKVFSPVIAVLDEIIAKADVGAKKLNKLIDSVTGTITGRGEKNSYQSLTNSQLITQKSLLEEEIRSYYFTNRTEDGSVIGGPIPEEKSLEAIKKEIERRKNDLIKVSNEAASEVSAAIDDVWGKFAVKFNLNESYYEKARRQRLESEKSVKSANDATAKAEKLAREQEKEAAEKIKNLSDAYKGMATVALKSVEGDFDKATSLAIAHIMDVTAAVGFAGAPGLGAKNGSATTLTGVLRNIPGLAKNASESLLKIKADNFIEFIKELKDNISVPETWVNLIQQLSKSQEELAQQGKDAVYNRQQTKMRDMQRQWQEEEEDRWLGQMEKLHSAMQINVADAFESGLYDAIENGGNFFEAFGNALKSQVARAMSTAITNQIFGTGGVVDLSSAITGGNSKSGNSTGTGKGLLGNIFKPIYNKNGSLNIGALGSNLAIGAAFSFLTSPGRLFGGSVVHGQESFDTSASLNDQVTQAKKLRDELYLQAGVSDVTRQLLDEAEFYSTYVRKTKSGNGITSKKTTTYLLEGGVQAQASIDYIKKLQEVAQGEQTRRNYDIFQASRYGSVGALEMSLNDAESSYSASQAKSLSETELAALRSDLAQYQQQLTQNSELATSFAKQGTLYNPYRANEDYIKSQIADLEKKIGDGQGYKYSESERIEMLQQRDAAKINLITAKEANRTNLTQTFLGDTTLASQSNADIMRMLLGDAALGNDQQMIGQMLPMLKDAGLADYNFRKMSLEAGDDPEKQTALGKLQLENLEKAASIYEQVWKDAEQEALDQTKTIEEQNAAFQRFQAAQSALLTTKEQILQTETQLAAIEKQKLDSKRMENIESALSLVGEIDQRGDRIVIIQGGDANVAIDEYMAEFADNPEVIALLQKAKTKIDAKARWG